MAKRKKSGVFTTVALSVLITALLCLGAYFALTLVLSDAPEETQVLLRATPTPKPVTPPPTSAPTPEPTLSPTPTPVPTPIPDTGATIRLVGDIMCHDRQLNSALQEDGSYRMDDWFDAIRPSLTGADLAIGNLETSFAGPEEGYTGFPHFNTPDIYADALKNAGFDVLTMANNHANDFRIAGIERTLQVLDDRGFLHTGAYASREAFNEQLIVNVNGIRVGILAYTDTFNSKPKEEYHVRRLDRELVKKDVAAMREGGADFILCMVHWGGEYEETTGSSQKKEALMLAECGVDAIFGSHPHVVQTAEMLTVAGEDGQTRTVPVAYSMGNFISNQQNRPCDMGVIFEVELKKSGETGQTQLVNTSFVPTVVYRWDEDHKDNYSVLPCGVYMEMDGHDKQHRCSTVYKTLVEMMGEGFEVKSE